MEGPEQMAQYRGRPAYLQIADDVRAQIFTGDLHDGDSLPSEARLMSEYGVSRIVVRNAMEVLKSEGMVFKHQGKGTFVREQHPALKRIVGDLYSSRPVSSPFAQAAKVAGRQPEWEYHSRRTTATAPIAERLRIGAGDEVMCTTYRFLADHEPILLSTSYEPLAITGGTPIESPESGPLVGVIARMDSIGQHIVSVTEEVSARAPFPFESQALAIPPGVPVMVIQRTYRTAERVVESAEIIVSAAQYTLEYHVPIPDDASHMP
jgi:GntR family transcriptional regulator